MAEQKIKSGKLLGIDIGTDTIKVAEIVADADGMVVVALGQADLPSDIIINEDIQNVRALGGIIKKLVRDCGVSSKKCVVSITAPTKMMIRVLEVPKSDNPKQVALSVKYEIERIFPYSSYDTEFDYAELPAKKSDGNALRTFVVAGHRKLVEDLLSVMKVAGLQLDAIEVADLAVGRILIDTASAQSEPICGILNIGANNSILDVFDGTTIRTPSLNLSVNGASFTRAISQVMDMSFDEADNFKKDYAMINMDIVNEYYEHKYGGNLDFDTSTFDTAFDDPNYNPAYAEASKIEKIGEDFSFDTTDTSSDYETTTDNPFEVADDKAAPDDLSENVDKEVIETPESSAVLDENTSVKEDVATEAPYLKEEPAFSLKEENEKLAEDLASKSGKKFTLDDMQENTVISGGKEKEHKEVDLEKSDDVCKMMLDQLDNLVNEIRAQLDEYYNTTGISVQKLIITGGTSRISGLEDFLTEYLGISVFKANPRDIVKFRMTSTNLDVLEDINSVYPVAIGLAMRDFIE